MIGLDSINAAVVVRTDRTGPILTSIAPGAGSCYRCLLKAGAPKAGRDNVC